ncbi:MAG TPA: hypothetical protein VFJ94_13810 [Intrasporangium sp.]|uniref:hypothetical protein n=1 Tax=Intrasporangium sp. TaxID=1925024 RepID=UPI002D77BDC2|nr:hypothetical protein [Intrasporangium sp.]HET7399588.1 hypothetical protein [Intrasporangium sp.]
MPVILAALALAACGTTAAPQTGATTSTVRPVTPQRIAADGALACPASLTDGEGSTVPAPPQGVDGTERLLPTREPASVVVCRYPVLELRSPGLRPPFALARRSVLPVDARRRLVDELAWAPRFTGTARACTAIGGDEAVQLVGAAYGDGVVWVAAKSDPNDCAMATNGDFVSRASLGRVIEDVVRGATSPPARRATAGPPAGPCADRTQGRLGDERSLAPEGDPQVTVCRLVRSGGVQADALRPDRGRQVVAALRALPVRPTGSTCERADSRYDRDFRIVLTYAVGPAVGISVSLGCRPPLLSGGLEADDVTGLASLVERSSPPVPGPDPDGSVSSDGAVSTP